jgi:hypothetical protein
MRNFSKLLVLGAALAVSTSIAYADTLGAGTINFGGNDKYTTTSVTFEGTQHVSGISTGSLSAFAAGEVAAFTNLPSFTTLPSTYFFQVNNGTDTLDFYLTSIAPAYTVNNGISNLILNGLGYFTETKDGGGIIDTSTPGAVSFTTQGSGVTTFSASSVVAPTPTPEPGSLMLLGTGLLSAAGIARKKFASKLS